MHRKHLIYLLFGKIETKVKMCYFKRSFEASMKSSLWISANLESKNLIGPLAKFTPNIFVLIICVATLKHYEMPEI
jgi:hypothetical protein